MFPYNYFKYCMFGKYNGFDNKARVSACMYFLVCSILRVPNRIWSRRHFERGRRQCGGEGTTRLGEGIRGRFFVKILKFKPSEMAFPGILRRSISSQEKFPRTENFPKISLLKVENFQLQNLFPRPITFYKIFFLPRVEMGLKVLEVLSFYPNI